MKLGKFVLFFGDVLFFYVSLGMTLLLRYGLADFQFQWNKLFALFSIVLILWLIVFYSAGFYDDSYARDKYLFFTETLKVFLVNLFVSISFFYILGPNVAPKRILVILIILYGLVFFCFRIFTSRHIKSLNLLTEVYFIGSDKNKNNLELMLGKLFEENIKFLGSFPIGQQFPSVQSSYEYLIIYDNTIVKNLPMQKKLFDGVLNNFKTISLNDFYEEKHGRIPLNTINELWFLENISAKARRFYIFSKRLFDILLSVLLLVILMPFLPFILIAIMVDDGWPVFFAQKRVGKNGQIFKAYKLRTMRNLDRKSSAWTKEDDKRITRVGGFLRRTHIDEVPQLFNVLFGYMSLVGPRPEQVEYSKTLEQSVSFFKIRNIVKPGITGWAQINYRYASSINDSKEKLEYDLYYIKNSSMSLDLRILVKTFYQMLNGNGR